MFAKIEDFFLNQLVGKIIARAAVSVASLVAGPLIQGKAAALGFSISVDPAAFEAGALTLGHGAFEAFKAWRAKASAPAPAA